MITATLSRSIIAKAKELEGETICVLRDHLGARPAAKSAMAGAD